MCAPSPTAPLIAPLCCSGRRRPDLCAQRRQEDDLCHPHRHRHRLLGLSRSGATRTSCLGAARRRAYCPPAISLRYSQQPALLAGCWPPGPRLPTMLNPGTPRARHAPSPAQRTGPCIAARTLDGLHPTPQTSGPLAGRCRAAGAGGPPSAAISSPHHTLLPAHCCRLCPLPDVP